MLPVPAGHVLYKREFLTVTTRGGVELGKGSEDGQVKGMDVSGLVTLDGKYRLVFKETNLGTGLIKFIVIQKPKPEPVEPKPAPLPQEVANEVSVNKSDKEEVKEEKHGNS